MARRLRSKACNSAAVRPVARRLRGPWPGGCKVCSARLRGGTSAKGSSSQNNILMSQAAPVGNVAILQGISQALAKISQRMEHLGMPPSQGGVFTTTVGRPRKTQGRHQIGRMSRRGARLPWGAKCQKARWAARAKGFSGSSSTSGEFLDEDFAHKDRSYWKAGAGILGLPSWISRHREVDTPSTGDVWGEPRGEHKRAQLKLKDFEDPPGCICHVRSWRGYLRATSLIFLCC